MPLREYLCHNCSNRFEVLTGVTSDIEETICPQCGSEDMERLLSVFSAKVNSDGNPCGSTACDGPGGICGNSCPF